MKKTFAFLLSLTMILSLFGLTTFAETDEQNSEHTGHIPIIGKNLHCTDDLYCLICGYHMVRDEYLIGFGNKLIHTVDNDIPCTEFGRYCKDCGLPVWGHSAGNSPCTEPATCVYCGKEMDPAEEGVGSTFYHQTTITIEEEETYINGDGKECTRICSYSYCPDYGMKVLRPEVADDPNEGCEHEWQDATCIAPKTCRICGAIEGDVNPNAHPETVTDDIVCYDRNCSACGAVIAPGHPEEKGYHNFDENHRCGNCGKTECELFGHTPGAEATKTEAQTCTVCGVVLKEATGKGNPHTAAGDLFGATAMLSLAAAAAVLLKKKR